MAKLMQHFNGPALAKRFIKLIHSIVAGGALFVAAFRFSIPIFALKMIGPVMTD